MRQFDPLTHVVIGIVAALVGAAAGCAKVDARLDLKRTAEMVAERTGVEQSYDPAEAELVEERVKVLLADGLTVDEAVRVALLNNRGFQALFETVGASRADVVQSGLLTNPSMGFGLQFPDGGGRSDITLGFAQQMVDLWQIPVRKKIAQSQLEQTILSVVSRGIEIAADAKIKSYQVISLAQSEALARENLRLLQKACDAVETRFKAGQVGRVDVDLARASLLEVQLELITIPRDRRVAEAALARVLGLSRSAERWTLRDTLPGHPASLPDDEALLATALRQRLDARVAALHVRLAEEEVRREYLAIFPSVTAGVALERNEAHTMRGRKILADTARSSVAAGSLTAPNIESRSDRAAARRESVTWKFGPVIDATVPIWDQNQARIARARFGLLQKQKEYDDLLDAVSEDVQKASVVVRACEELLRFYRTQALPQVKESLRLTRDAYAAGEQDIATVIAAERGLLALERAHQEAMRDCAIGMAELERAVGGRLPAVAATQPSKAGES